MRVRNPHPRLILVANGPQWIMVPPGQEVDLPEGLGAIEVKQGHLIALEEPTVAPEEPEAGAPKPKKATKKASKAKGK